MNGPDNPPPEVKSPCISVCTMDPRSGYCTGCLRTLDEIAGWIDLDPDEKRELVRRLPERRARLREMRAAASER